MPLKKKMRYLRFGLQTLLTPFKKGYFIPYRYAAQIPEKKDYQAFRALLDQKQSIFKSHAQKCEEFAEEFLALSRSSLYQPDLDQAWFPLLDAYYLYTYLRILKPSKIIEIGSGQSTRFTLSALDKNKVQAKLILIDPQPRANIPENLSNHITLSHQQMILQEAPNKLFESLKAGDILFIDSSHLLVPGSDVDLLITEILPQLKKGVIIHVHDIFLPDAYPESWTWRGYNEQSAFASLCLTGVYDILWATHYLSKQIGFYPQNITQRQSINVTTYPSSLWLVKN
jgi:predicted O-methyltransferase YrrM